MAKVKKSKQSSDNTLEVFIFTVATLFAALFVLSVFEVAQTAVQTGVLNAPNSFAGGLAAILALFSYANASRLRYKYGGVVLLTIVVAAVAFWLFGLTSAGSSLTSY